ncbi:MAG: DUF2934 domain-containing protein [Nitrosomonadales bacterium]|nr:DUF2934 domain-containing protein [Nitrosomonadales bacterium]
MATDKEPVGKAKPAARKAPAAAKSAAQVKAAAPAKRVARKVSKPASVSPEDRYHMIATAAYYLAEKRGFAGGYEMNDWISAEAQIDGMISKL